MKKTLNLLLAVAGLLTPHFAFAWDGAGHELIAAEAYQELSPEQKAEVFEVLKHHPDFTKWAAAYHPNPAFDVAGYVFMRSSMWPDEIRRSGIEYDHPDWHFIDYPLKPTAFPFLPGPKPTDDILFGLNECEKTLSDTNANPELRAVYLSYLIHLIGDLHQPLHCASLFNDTYPEGDRGGNDFYVNPGRGGVRLHGIWDGMLGTAINPREQWNYAIKLEAKFPASSLPGLVKHTTPKQWSLESRRLAIDYGYLKGQLQGSTNLETAPRLPDGYLKNAKAVAEKQGALAGYRLTGAINMYLKCAGPVPLLPPNTNSAALGKLPQKIGTAEAGKYYDESMTVTGKVAQVTARPTVTFINLDQTGPNSPFTAVIFQENAASFKDLPSLQGRNVAISGTITEYHNKPEMILETQDQLKIIDDK